MQVRFPAAVAIFLLEAKSGNGFMFGISEHVKDPWVIKINSEPFLAVRLITCVVPAR